MSLRPASTPPLANITIAAMVMSENTISVLFYATQGESSKEDYEESKA